MAGLPFLVVHGGEIATGAVVLAAVVALGAFLAVRDRRVLRHARAEVRGLADRAGPPREGEVVVRGIYRDGALDHDGERIELHDAFVIYGSRARLGWRGVRHLVRDGDAVLARGVMSAAAPLGEAGYRDGKPRWILRSTDLFGTPPATRAPPLTPRRALLALAGVLAASWCALYAIGACCLRGVRSHVQPRTAEAIDAFDPLAIAAAMPGTRDDALAVIAAVIDAELVRTPATAALRVDVAELARGCPGKVAALTDALELDAAVAAADACDAPELAARAQLELGRPGEAKRWLDQLHGDIAIDVAIGAGQWGAAAAAAHAQATSAGGDWTRKVLATPSGAASECLALLLDAHAGVATAAAHASELSGVIGLGYEPCRIVTALLEPPARRGPELREVAAWGQAVTRLGDLSRHLAWLDGAATADPPQLLDADVGDVSDEAWLAPLALAANATPIAHGWMAVHDVLRGDFAVARADAAAAGDDRGLVRQIALRAGAASEPPTGFAVDPSAGRCDPGAALQAAAGGDGGALAFVLERCPDELVSTRSLLAVLPYVTAERARVAAALRARQAAEPVRSAAPFAIVQTAALARDLARLAGDTEAAARWQAIVERQLAGLTDRDRLIALLLHDRL